MNRQKQLLAVLLVILAAAVSYSLIRTPTQGRVERLKYQPGMTAENYREAQATRDDTRVRLDLLDKEPPGFSGFRRNIFRSLFSNGPKGSAALPVIPNPVVPPPPPPPPPPVEKTPAQIAMEELGQIAFLGYLQKDDRTTVFLARNNQIFLVKKGDRLINKYEVADISEKMLTIDLAPGGEQVVIPLQQGRPMAQGRGGR